MNEIKVSYAQTVYGKKEIDAVVKCLKESTQMGNYSSKFEKKYLAYLIKNMVCMLILDQVRYILVWKFQISQKAGK